MLGFDALGRLALGEVPSTTPAALSKGWLGQLSKAPQIVALPVAAAMTWCPQPITPAVAATPSLGWQGPLSIAPKLASVPYSQPQLVLRDIPRVAFGWQPPLSLAVLPAPSPPRLAAVWLPYPPTTPPVTIVGMAWFSPLSGPPPQISYPKSPYSGWAPGQPGSAPVVTVEHHDKPFFATVGQLMGM